MIKNKHTHESYRQYDDSFGVECWVGPLTYGFNVQRKMEILKENFEVFMEENLNRGKCGRLTKAKKLVAAKKAAELVGKATRQFYHINCFGYADPSEEGVKENARLTAAARQEAELKIRKIFKL